METLKRLEGRVQVYLPDLKYALTEPAKAYSGAADYPETAKAAILEMFRQTGPYSCLLYTSPPQASWTRSTFPTP